MTKTPTEIYRLAEKFFSKTRKVSCYTNDGWTCPVYKFELECDADCKKNIQDCCKQAYRNGVIKIENGRVKIREDFFTE